jgi:thiol-disulfide isomerase/thioredoxin
MRRQILLALGIILTAAFLVTCGSDDTAHNTARATAHSGGAAAANAQAISKYALAPDIDGNMQNFTKWIGQQPVVINFWGTWCPPCQREIPDLVRLYKEYNPKGVEIVSLAVKDTPERVRAYADKAGMSWVHLMATDQSYQMFGLTGAVPTTIFYDRNGNETARFVGMRDYDTFKKAFEEIASS